ncbi:MAG: TetR/AcrR family transcriptional regulator [Sphingomonadales bacterium]|nr:MAG: TetR/AcrR family transcriptional regulator [Sphingomonadales bacterium]
MAASAPKATAPISPKRPRKSAKSIERWNQILDVATRLFREKGFAATSMQDVSDEVGLLKGSLYYYVRSKEDLLFGILRDLHENGEEIIAAIDFDSTEPLKELERFLLQIVLYAGEHADRLAIFLRDFTFVPQDKQSEIIKERDMYTHACERLIERAIKMKQISRKVNARIAANALLRGASSTHEWYRADGPMKLKDIADQVAGILVRGVANYTP